MSTTSGSNDLEWLKRIEAVRRFNRFYTRQIGLLQEGLWRSPFTLTEARVIYELAHHEALTATHLSQELGLDGGYISRIMRKLHGRGLVQTRHSPADGRQKMLSLTVHGQEAFSQINAVSRGDIEAMLSTLIEPDQQILVESMQKIESLLEAAPERRVPYILRPHNVGDVGWVIYRHGILYHREYGWDERFEALVARVAADFIENFDPQGERCWIAEREGEPVGSVFLVRHPRRKGVARLRLLLVEPKARGLGIGRRLVQECSRFARQAGYHTITLWTNSILDSARHIYVREGYVLIEEKPHRSFGHDLIGQTWELEL